jgi:hypothetical protein
MRAAVRSGGVLAVEDADFDGVVCEPANEGVSFFKRLYTAVLERKQR